MHHACLASIVFDGNCNQTREDNSRKVCRYKKISCKNGQTQSELVEKELFNSPLLIDLIDRKRSRKSLLDPPKDMLEVREYEIFSIDFFAAIPINPGQIFTCGIIS
jgi:hypothetical protein